MKKKIKDVTFKEFSKWVNRRVCDAQWSMITALVVIDCIAEVNKHIFKEKYWNKVKGKYFILEGEIEVEDE